MNRSLHQELLIEKDILLFLRYLTNLAKRLLSNPGFITRVAIIFVVQRYVRCRL
jgi:hypothetical protein